MATRALAMFFWILATWSTAQAEGPYLFRNPALSATQIVFSFAGDLWSVGREGGDARRLTTGTGVETGAHFSPDGTQIAFTGEYDGNVDVFVMPVAGGVPRRLTFHPRQDTAEGWTPDGKRVLFSSSRSTANDGVTLFTMPVAGGFPDEIPLPIAMEGAFSPDASHLAYVPLFQWQEAWKRYRGGQTKKIWIADMKDSSVVEIPRKSSNDFNPMWAGGFIYFLSDRDGAVTLYSYDTKTKQVKRAVDNSGLDLKSASLGPGAIAYEQFGSLHLYDLKTGKTRPVSVRLAGDLPEMRPRFVNVTKRLSNPGLSPGGARAVFEARGEIVTVPAEKGEARNLTGTTGVFERDPAWSPDGKTIAYFSEESGEYELHVREQSGMGAVKKFKLGDNPAFYTAPRWSPDSKKIAYLDNHLGIWYLDLDTSKPVLVDTDYYVSNRERAPAWSPDNKWLAYPKQIMIINEFAGSGGDAMPWYFRRAGVGKLIGKRTWGGLVGMSGVPELMDGGVVTAPSAAIWNPNGQYDVENIGTPPDIEVEQDPKAVRLGRDPQLETAVSVVLEELAKNPAPAMKRPPFPNYHRKKD